MYLIGIEFLMSLIVIVMMIMMVWNRTVMMGWNHIDKFAGFAPVNVVAMLTAV